jgi:murein DD-endopeptidase MepM/ murein hydrolase activator NlpD
MKKVYYFSKEKLQFIEIKDFKFRLAVTISSAVVIISLMLCGSYSYIFSLINSNRDVNLLKNENEILKEKLGDIVSQYGNLNNELDSLINKNGELRIAANLPVISDEERMLGFGGGSFDNSLEFLNSPNSIKIKKASELTEELTRKIYFEKSNYSEIASKLNQNKEFYTSMPALKPCSGSFAYHGFGMRMHPILNKVRMHEGIDIITEVGTKVVAPGKGKVVFAGYKGSYGLTVEIDHGFGYRTLYAHLSRSNVKKGDYVNRNEFIATTGNTGLSTGPHLHYEIEHDGVKQDPIKFIFDDIDLFN